MLTYPSENSIAIIGAGLVGGAVLSELALKWARVHGKQAAARSETRAAFSIDKIHITATSESKLIHQVQKTSDLLSREEGISLEQDSRLELTIRSGENYLSITAEPLDILPKGLTSTNVEDENFREQSSLYAYLASRRPRILVIGANLASIVAYRMGEMRTQTLAWILATLKKAVDRIGIETLAIVGTTALGGQGTNLAWTHQSAQALDSKLTGKILAAYGLLGVLDRMCWDTDSNARLILLTPGSVLGYDYLDFGPVKFFSIPEDLPKDVKDVTRGSGMCVPLYEPLEVDLQALSDQTIEWDKRRIADAFLTGAKIKCGENGELSPLQFACLTHALQMGFNSNVYIARILIDELLGKSTGYNQIPLGSGKVIEPSAQGQNDRNLILQRLAELERENNTRSAPVYPAVGSARAQKEIILADLLYRLLGDRSGEPRLPPTLQQLSAYDPKALANDLWAYLQDHPRLLAEITAVIPVISPEGRVYTGPHVMYLGKGIHRSADLVELIDMDLFQDFAALGAVDLRPVSERIGQAYDTGVELLVKRAQFILDHCVKAFPPSLVDGYGSTIDSRTRHWMMLTSEAKTTFDPVFFVIQFLGGERPYQ